MSRPPFRGEAAPDPDIRVTGESAETADDAMAAAAMLEFLAFSS